MKTMNKILAVTLLSMCTTLALTSCGGKSTNIIPMGDEAPAVTEEGSADTPDNSSDPEIIASRISTIYEAVAAAYPEVHDISPSTDSLDTAFCSGEWQTLVEMVNSKDAESMGGQGFFDSDYWIMGQDWGAISVSDISIDVKDKEHADATLILHNGDTDTKVKLEMLFERGEWLINNFIDQSNGINWKKGMIKHLEEKSATNDDGKKDDGIIEYEY